MRKQGGGGALKRAAAPCFGMEGVICVSVWFLSAGMGFSFRVKALRFIFKAFSIRFVYACYISCSFHNPLHPLVLQKYVTSKKYFGCLSLEFDSYELLRTLKMISESVLIFLQKYVIFKKVFRLFTPRFRYVWTSSHAKNDQWFSAHLFAKQLFYLRIINLVSNSQFFSLSLSLYIYIYVLYIYIYIYIYR